jgi:hypothetical protein
MFLRFFLVILLLLTGFARAEVTAAQQLSAELLTLAGTVSVFAYPSVQKALADPFPFLGAEVSARRERLLTEAGLRIWQPPRVWILQSGQENGVGDERHEHWDNLAPQLQLPADIRGYTLIKAVPLASTEAAFSFLTPDKVNPGLHELLAAYNADVLVLLRGRHWVLWHEGFVRQGDLPETGLALLPDGLAETLAAQQQWPEAAGRVVLQVSQVNSLADFVAVQSALQALPGVAPLQLIRTARNTVWFALSSPSADELARALNTEPRLAAVMGNTASVQPDTLSATARKACRLFCVLQIRQWQADVPTKVPAAQGSAVPLSVLPAAISPVLLPVR